MVHLPRDQYPNNLPEHVYHHDLDPVSMFRLAKDIDNDYYVQWWERQDTNLPDEWAAYETPLDGPVPISEPMKRRAQIIMKDRQIRDLQQQVANAPVQPPPPPPPVVNTERNQIRAHAPTAFSGIPNDKGEYKPEAREFVREMQSYIDAQEVDTYLSEDKRMAYAMTYLTGEAAVWIEQLKEEKEEFMEEQEDADDPKDYEGPLRSLEKLLDALLVEFEDVDREATAQHKLETLHMGQETAEAHVRRFKTLARYSGYNDKALVGYFKRSLTPGLKSKITQLAERPVDLKDWYQRAIKFDRQWREDQDERRNSRSTTTPRTNTTTTPRNNNSSNNSPAPPSNQSQPRNPNQWQPRNGWRPWGAPQQSAPRAPAPVTNTNTGVVPMDIDAANAVGACYRCGQTGHLARFCTTPESQIRQRYGRDRMIPPPRFGQPMQNRVTTFANASEFVNSLSPEQRAELAQSFATPGASGSTASPSSSTQDFASGSS